MNDQDLLLIERYHRAELSEAERMAVEQRMVEDAEFKAEVLLHGQALQAVRVFGRERLRERLKALPPGRSRPVWPVVLLLLGLVSVTGWWWWNQSFRTGLSPAEPAPAGQPVDTPPAINTQPGPMDTAGPEIQPIQKSPEPGIAARPTDPEQLFAASFQPYRDRSLDPNVRNDGTPLTPFQRFRLAYWEGRYREALEAYEQLDPEVKDSDQNRFVRAVALLATGRADAAAPIFEDLRATQSDYAAQADWYLALSALKKGDLARTTTLLRAVAADAASPHRADADKLLKKLR